MVLSIIKSNKLCHASPFPFHVNEVKQWNLFCSLVIHCLVEQVLLEWYLSSKDLYFQLKQKTAKNNWKQNECLREVSNMFASSYSFLDATSYTPDQWPARQISGLTSCTCTCVRALDFKIWWKYVQKCQIFWNKTKSQPNLIWAVTYLSMNQVRYKTDLLP